MTRTSDSQLAARTTRLAMALVVLTVLTTSHAAAVGEDDLRSSASADGFLVTPVAGVVTSPFGYLVHPISKCGGPHDGMDYASNCGQPLVTP
jgi:murein DD-endopeptidase MepM/ murein hydrolase activator NlpD